MPYITSKAAKIDPGRGFHFKERIMSRENEYTEPCSTLYYTHSLGKKKQCRIGYSEE
jgi:hypothetical protein